MLTSKYIYSLISVLNLLKCSVAWKKFVVTLIYKWSINHIYTRMHVQVPDRHSCCMQFRCSCFACMHFPTNIVVFFGCIVGHSWTRPMFVVATGCHSVCQTIPSQVHSLLIYIYIFICHQTNSLVSFAFLLSCSGIPLLS